MNNFYQQFNGSSLYGNYRTRTFADIFESGIKFLEEWNETDFSKTEFVSIGEQEIQFIHALLYSRYGNSTIASSDENRFKYQLFSYVFQYAPAWLSELNIQKQVREMDIASFQEGSLNIVNNAQNPSTQPTSEILEFINSQNTQKTKRSAADAIALKLSLLKEDVTETFVTRFRKLFLTIVEPELPLWYVTEED